MNTINYGKVKLVSFFIAFWGISGCTSPERIYLGEFNGISISIEHIYPSCCPVFCQAFDYIMDNDVRSLEKLITQKGVSPKAILENYFNHSLFNVALLAGSEECAKLLYKYGGAENGADPLQTWLTLKFLVKINDEVFRDVVLSSLEVDNVDFHMLSPFKDKQTIVDELQQEKQRFQSRGNTVMVQKIDSYLLQFQRRFGQNEMGM